MAMKKRKPSLPLGNRQTTFKIKRGGGEGNMLKD